MVQTVTRPQSNSPLSVLVCDDPWLCMCLSMAASGHWCPQGTGFRPQWRGTRPLRVLQHCVVHQGCLHCAPDCHHKGGGDGAARGVPHSPLMGGDGGGQLVLGTSTLQLLSASSPWGAVSRQCLGSLQGLRGTGSPLGWMSQAHPGGAGIAPFRPWQSVHPWVLTWSTRKAGMALELLGW